MKKFTVIAKSENTNNFGLRQFVLITKDGEGWKVLRSAYSGSPEWQEGEEVQVPLSEDDTLNWARLGVECPEQLPAVPQQVLNQVFGEKVS